MSPIRWVMSWRIKFGSEYHFPKFSENEYANACMRMHRCKSEIRSDMQRVGFPSDKHKPNNRPHNKHNPVHILHEFVVCCAAAARQRDASPGLLLSSLRRDAFSQFTRCCQCSCWLCRWRDWLCWWLCCRREAVRAAAGARQLRRATARSLPLQRSPSRTFHLLLSLPLRFSHVLFYSIPFFLFYFNSSLFLYP